MRCTGPASRSSRARWRSPAARRSRASRSTRRRAIGEGLFIDHGVGVVIGETARDRRRRHALPGRDARRHGLRDRQAPSDRRGRRHGRLGREAARARSRSATGRRSARTASSSPTCRPTRRSSATRATSVRVDGRRVEGPDADWVHLPDPVADAIRGPRLAHRGGRARGGRDGRRDGHRPAAAAGRRPAPAPPARPQPRRRVGPAAASRGAQARDGDEQADEEDVDVLHAGAPDPGSAARQAAWKACDVRHVPLVRVALQGGGAGPRRARRDEDRPGGAQARERQGLLADGQPEGARVALDAAAARRVEDPAVAGRGDEAAGSRARTAARPPPGPRRRGRRAAGWRRGAGPARRAGGGRPLVLAQAAGQGHRRQDRRPGRRQRAGLHARRARPGASSDPGAQRPAPARPAGRQPPGASRPSAARAGAQAVEVRVEVDRGAVAHQERLRTPRGGVGARAGASASGGAGRGARAARALGGQPRPGRAPAAAAALTRHSSSSASGSESRDDAAAGAEPGAVAARARRCGWRR